MAAVHLVLPWIGDGVHGAVREVCWGQRTSASPDRDDVNAARLLPRGADLAPFSLTSTDPRLASGSGTLIDPQRPGYPRQHRHRTHTASTAPSWGNTLPAVSLVLAYRRVFSQIRLVGREVGRDLPPWASPTDRDHLPVLVGDVERVAADTGAVAALDLHLVGNDHPAAAERSRTVGGYWRGRGIASPSETSPPRRPPGAAAALIGRPPSPRPSHRP
jgi:hypothetical protein